MLRCNDCGARFEYPKTVQEYRGEFWGAPAYETVGCCPECDGDDFEEDIEEELKEYWVSAYSLITGNQFGASFEAVDEDDMLDQFDKKYPECEIADYGCWNDYIEEDPDEF